MGCVNETRDRSVQEHGADYKSGFEEGRKQGYSVGHKDGYDAGCKDGFDAGRREGHDSGYSEGHAAGLKLQPVQEFVPAIRLVVEQRRAGRFVAGYASIFYKLKDAETVAAAVKAGDYSALYPLAFKRQDMRNVLKADKLEQILAAAKGEGELAGLAGDIVKEVGELKCALTTRTVIRSFLGDGFHSMLECYGNKGVAEYMALFREYLDCLKGSLVEFGKPVANNGDKAVEVYRGIRVDSDKLKQWKDAADSADELSKYGLFPGFTSATSDAKVIDEFIRMESDRPTADKTAPIFAKLVIELTDDTEQFSDFLAKFSLASGSGIFYPVDVHEHSAFSQEREVVFPPFYPFKIKSVDDRLCIRLLAPNHILLTKESEAKTAEFYIDKMCELLRMGIRTDLRFSNQSVIKLGMIESVKEVLKSAKKVTAFVLDSETKIELSDVAAIADLLAEKSPSHLRIFSMEDAGLGPEEVKALAVMLNGNTELRALNLNGNKIGASGAKAIAEGLSKQTQLASLRLNRNNIGAEGANAIIPAVSQIAKSLKLLDISNNYMGAESLAALEPVLNHVDQVLIEGNLVPFEYVNSIPKGKEKVNALLASSVKQIQSLAKVDLSDQQIGPAAAKGLASVLQVTMSIEELNLSSNPLDEEGTKAIVSALSKAEKLTTIDLSNCKLGIYGAKALSPALKGWPSLLSLNLANNEIFPEGGIAIGAGLGECVKLHTLNLNFNKLGAKGANGIAVGLRGCKSLACLDISSNDIGADGAKAISSALRECKSIDTLNFSADWIGAEGAKALSSTLKECPALSFLDLRLNGICDEGAKELGAVLGSCKKLSVLNLRSNKIRSEGTRAIGEGMKGCKSLTKVDMSNNEVDAEGAKAVAELLGGDSEMGDMNMSYNWLGDAGAKAIVGAMGGCKKLTNIDIRFNQVPEETKKEIQGDKRLSCQLMNTCYVVLEKDVS